MNQERTRCRKGREEEKQRPCSRVQPPEQNAPNECSQGEERCRVFFQQAFDGALLIDEKTSRILDVSGAFLALLGHTERDAVAGHPFADLLFDQGEPLSLATLVGRKRELRFLRQNQSALDAEVRAVRFPYGEHPSICLTIQDLTERKLLERSLLHEATHDHLTGLPNRKHFASRIQQEIAYHQRRQKTLAVLILDLDNFKQVNDTFGHRIGDELLREFAQRLRMTVREYDVVARFGGDEFQIGLIDVGSMENIAYVARKLMDLFSTPFRVENHRIDYVTGSIGIALYPDDGENAETLFTAADAALYEAKRKGKRRYRFYRPARTAAVTSPLWPRNPPDDAKGGRPRTPSD